MADRNEDGGKPLTDKDLAGVSGGIIIQKETTTGAAVVLPGTAKGFDPQPDPPVSGVENPTTRR